MTLSVGSQPGAGRFRSALSIILILILIFVFLGYTSKWQAESEKAASQLVLNRINSVLALVIYQKATSGELGQLNAEELLNPFVLLAMYDQLPANYRGAVLDRKKIDQPGWYYLLNENVAVFVDSNLNHSAYKVELDYLDVNLNGQFDYQTDSLNSLSIKKAS